MEYRVYAEDPSRKFLPQIGFVKKYKEPVLDDPARRVRIDTGVEEGSEISMYYDPMIAKLITWGKDRKEASDILDRAFDEYVIQGVTHNIGFGKSILANEKFAAGDYSTAFIDTFYPEGFSGDKLSKDDFQMLSVVAHNIKNIHLNHGSSKDNSRETLFMTIDGIRGDDAQDFQVDRCGDEYKVTNLSSGNSQTLNIKDFDFDYNSLITLKIDGENKILQYNSVGNDGIKYNFSMKGNQVKMSVYTPAQFKYKQHMPEPVQIDYAKSIISPMPGTIVSTSVQPGDTVVEGQQLCIIEAMKMQNVLKAEISGTIDQVNVKAGDSVAVDELLISFK